MDRMKDYRQLIKELPSNTVVFAFGRFQPPTALHELQIKVVKKLAEEHKSDYVIYASKDHKEELLSEDKKVQYMNLMFPQTNIKTSETTSIIEAAKELNKKYKKLVLVTSSDLKEEAEKILNKKNGTEYQFESIEVVVAGDADPESNKLCEAAKKGDFVKFKTGLPAVIREIDSRRLMNDIRQGLGLEIVKEEIKLVKNELREQYFRKEIFNVGDIVEHNGNKLTIIKRGSNHLLLKEQTGNLISKWIQDVTPTEEKDMNEDLTTKTLRNTDAIKVARMIANMLGIDNAEASSSPNNLVNRALYKIRTKTLNAETLNILNKMLSLATQVGIVYDNNLVPSKLKEGIIQSNATDKVSGDAASVDTYSEKDKKKKFAKGQQITFEQAREQSSVEDQEKTGEDEPSRTVGHALYARNDHHRRRKVGYHLGEAYKKKSAYEKINNRFKTLTGRSLEDSSKEWEQHRKDTIERMKQYEKDGIIKKQTNEETIFEGKMGQIHADIEDHLGKHLTDYKRVGGADHFGNQTVKTAKHIAKLHKIEPKHAQKFVNDYVEANLKEENINESEEHELGISHAHPYRHDLIKSILDKHNAKHSGQSDKSTYFKIDADKVHTAKKELKSNGVHADHWINGELKEEVHIDESHKLGDKVIITKGSESGQTGTVGEIRHGAFKDAPKTFTVDTKGGSIQLKKTHIKRFKESYNDDKKEVELKEGTFKYHMDKAIAAHERGDSKKKEYHLGNAKTARYSIPSSDYTKHKELFDKYKQMTEEVELEEAKKKEEDKTKIKMNPTIKDDSFQLGNTNARAYDAFFEEDEISDKEIDKMVDSVGEEDLMEVYEDDELTIIDEETGEEILQSEDEKSNESSLMEVLSRSERMKARARFARTKSKRERSTRIALKMYSSSTKINQRARRLAIKLLKKRLLRGRDISKISIGEKERIERVVQKRKPVIDRIAMKLTTRIRQIEKARLAHNKFTKSAPTVAF